MIFPYFYKLWSLSKLPISFFETFDEVAEVNLKFKIERWQEYFWCRNIIPTTNEITLWFRHQAILWENCGVVWWEWIFFITQLNLLWLYLFRPLQKNSSCHGNFLTNKAIFAICIDPSSTINPTKFLLANIVILFNLFSLVCVWRNPYFNVKVHSRGSQSHFLTTTSHISICQHIASITQNSQKVFLTASRKYFCRKGGFVWIESFGQHKVSTYLSVKNTKSNLAGRTSKR